MSYLHQELAGGKWNAISFFEQMANIGSEIGRTMAWRSKNTPYSQQAFDRALELLDLTINDSKNAGRLKELLRVREILIDYFQCDNQYGSNDTLWENYFYCFNYAARNQTLV
jgi:hypothetical protein